MTLEKARQYAIAILLAALFANSATAQVRVDAADQRVVGELQRVESLLADRQWDEAIETIRRLNGSDGDRLYKIDAWRYVPVRHYTQTLLGQLPPEALARYRKLVDPAAEQDYLAGHFDRVVREAYASSYTDDALLALGEAALAQGDADRAYRLWEQILPPPLPPATENTQDAKNPKPAWPGLPDSDIDPAAVRARLILASILGNHAERARDELARFVQLHPDARGRFAGRDEANYAEVLQKLLEEPVARTTNHQEKNSDWPTFAGNPKRNRAVRHAVDASHIAWRQPLDVLRLSAPFGGYEHQPHRKDVQLAYHPAIDRQGQLFLTGENRILGFDAQTGKPLWESQQGVIYQEMEYGEKTPSVLGPSSDPISNLPEGTLGLPRFTTTLRDGRLYARLGTPLTNRADNDAESIDRDVLVCLDLKAQGRLIWQIDPDGEDWAFDGTPVADGKNVYVAMRHGGLRPESHVACFDAARGTMRWRQFVCSAPTRSVAGRTPGNPSECTHNLLTLNDDTLYLNTNLGAVASLETETGTIRWLTLYSQKITDKLTIPPAHTARALCPCVYDRGKIYVAPSDAAAIFAVDAFSGELLWSTGHKTADVVHLLGTLDEELIAAGDRLYWIATDGPKQGQIVRRFPDGEPIAAYGRGLLAEGRIYWPTRQQLFIFEGKELAKTVDLFPLGLTGGNLTIAGNRLLITTDRETTALE